MPMAWLAMAIGYGDRAVAMAIGLWAAMPLQRDVVLMVYYYCGYVRLGG